MSVANDFLERIVADRRRDIAEAKRLTPANGLLVRLAEAPPVRDFAGALAGPGISLIGEIKRVSPAKGSLNANADPAALATAYAASGVRAISVLTEPRHFYGSLDDLALVRRTLELAGTAVPLLCKDFFLDPYQVMQARLAGADAILVIVAIVDDAQLLALVREAERLGMTPLVEVNNEDETRRAITAGATLIGINNRNLHTFEVALETTARLRPLIPAGRLVASLSAISTAADVEQLAGWGVDAMLVGEALMTAPDPAARARELAGWGEHYGARR